ncbi:unnamed protein product [Arabidopsis thaliana]|uniref:(thale cress) hypothetical protein n=1 Tax=Arabidopsis thaliana TaxID=3702 RepID=A0A7G2ETJ6_ARATH|nr:unnamed protein product [Arabidopsis thaliana]
MVVGEGSELYEEDSYGGVGVENDLSFLKGGYKRMNEMQLAQGEKLESMDILLKTVAATLERMEIRAGKQTDRPDPSQNSPQSVINSAFQQRGSGENNFVLDNRASLLRKIEIPVFDGSQPYEWFSKVERFFRVGPVKSFTPRQATVFQQNKPLLLTSGSTPGVLDDEMLVVDTELMEVQKPLACQSLSLNSFLGLHSPRTTKLVDVFGKSRVVILLDSGASHNFITPTVAAKLKLQLYKARGLDGMLGNGVSVHGSSICKAVQFQLSGVDFQSDFIALRRCGYYFGYAMVSHIG